jgi:hypothetical protein
MHVPQELCHWVTHEAIDSEDKPATAHSSIYQEQLVLCMYPWRLATDVLCQVKSKHKIPVGSPLALHFQKQLPTQTIMLLLRDLEHELTLL